MYINHVKKCFCLINHYLYKLTFEYHKYVSAFRAGKQETVEDTTTANAIASTFICRKSDGIIYINPAEPHFYIGGLPFVGKSANIFSRLPPKSDKFEIPARTQEMSQYCAGAYIDFSSDAKKILIRVRYASQMILKHMSLFGSAGVDVYYRKNDEEPFQWLKCIAPKSAYSSSVENEVTFSDNNKKEIRIYLPPFAVIDTVSIGLEPEAHLYRMSKAYQETIVVYGSSITQGCAACRPGINYTSLISRKLFAEVYNFGFSESAKGTLAIAQIIASLNPKAVIVEYDHNATVPELRDTHEKFYRMIRRYNADTSVIFLSRLSGGISISDDEMLERNMIIKTTFEKALGEGDSRVLFLDGNKLLPVVGRADYFADGKHPNDLGIKVIAEALCVALQEMDKQ